jgi:glycosyltransferase involved in cell wall biosynthesis
VIRDMVVLLATRWMFRATILHFHAGGISDLYPRLPGWLRPIFRLAYFHAEAGIRISELNPPDAAALRSRREFIIPCGISDFRPQGWTREGRPIPEAPRILFVGMLCESKGVLDLLAACGRLRKRGLRFSLDVMGRFERPEFERRARALAAELGLEGNVSWLGALSGAEKAAAFAAADLFCFPTYYECETFGIVVLEAMCFGLPVVATRWRGLPAVIADGASGYLVEVRDVEALADRLALLLQDPERRGSMGRKGRERFERDFSSFRFHGEMAGVFAQM